MRNLFIVIFLIPFSVYPQLSSFDFHSLENIKKFADYLFCEGDYLRAIEQYGLLKDHSASDTTDFKMMLGYSNLGLYEESNKYLNGIDVKSNFYSDAYLLSLKNELLIEPQLIIASNAQSLNSIQLKSYRRLTTISMLYEAELNILREDFISPFDEDERNAVASFYDFKVDPHYKSPAFAGTLSAIIPGSGKMYVGEWGDGVTALVVTSLFAFLAYDNFRADHTTRAWIFTGLGAFFYAGNIYGSIASAQIFNAKIEFEFNEGLNLFLEKNNYFLPEYDFCK
jgi:TM2 domain-containing membrane protein YozV